MGMSLKHVLVRFLSGGVIFRVRNFCVDCAAAVVNTLRVIHEVERFAKVSNNTRHGRCAELGSGEAGEMVYFRRTFASVNITEMD